ncbi:MAG: thymidylate synthase (FAD), partial [Alphaproteobacteria bacterium]
MTAIKKTQEASEIETLSTRRAVAPELEKILYEPHNVLAHGLVRDVAKRGADAARVPAARVTS